MSYSLITLWYIFIIQRCNILNNAVASSMRLGSLKQLYPLSGPTGSKEQKSIEFAQSADAEINIRLSE